MKKAISGFAVLALAAIVGCNNESTPGGPGVTNPAPARNQPTYGEAAQTFKLSPPYMATTVHQGESKDITIAIDRGKNFDGDVTLDFAEEPKGVTVETPNPVIKHGDKDAKVTVRAASDASLGDFSVKVLGHPTSGPDATSEFKITVAKK
jgi:hypothetical protein